MPSKKRRWARRLGVGLLALVLAGVVAAVIAHEPRPVPVQGREAEADALARSMVQAVGGDAWEQTGAVRFRFLDHTYLWDRQRDLVEVQWGTQRVLLSTQEPSGVAFDGGQRSTGPDATEAVNAAWKRFCNDSFWLNAVTKMFDPGTRRGLVVVPEAPGGHGVLVTYASGGVTPGDSYLWVPGADGRPARWKMWVSIIPIGGIEASWEGWQRLGTGAYIATRHEIGPATLRVEDVEGAATLSALLGDAADPFVEANMVEDPNDTIEY